MKDYLEIIQQRNEREIKQSKKEIDDFISKYDPIETLFYISKYYYMSQSLSVEEKIQQPIVNFLFNMYLKQKKISTKKPSQKDIHRLKETLINYCRAFHWPIRHKENNNNSWHDFLYLSQSQYLLNLINPEIYPNQLEKKFCSLFGEINSDNIEDLIKRKKMSSLSHNFLEKFGLKPLSYSFFKEFGFKPLIARAFSRAVANIYDKKFKNHDTNFLFTEDDIEDDIETLLKEKLPKNERDAFREEICTYLENCSIQIGEGNPNYNSLLDEDISWKKPIIKTQNGYLGINIEQIQYGIIHQLECLIKDKKESHKTLWKQYNNAKSKYAEELAYTSFQKVFKDRVYKNLKYQYKGKDYEVDILIEYDNKIIIAEVKSGSLRYKAKAGGYKQQLEYGLKEIIGKAYEQTQRTSDYILSEDKPIFYQGSKPIHIEKSSHLEVFSICIGLENLMMITQNLKTTKLQNLFKENQYPWAVNLLELEIILNHIEYPSLFIHYIKSRLEVQVQDEQTICALDELSYFGLYLTNSPCGGFNFKGNDQLVFIPSEWIAPFDDYYCSHNPDPQKKPKLNLDPRLRRFIKEWDNLYTQNAISSIHLNDLKKITQTQGLTIDQFKKLLKYSSGHSDAIYWLLYFDFVTLKKIFDLIEGYIKDTEKNKRPHSLCLGAEPFCLTFHSQYQQEGLEKQMLSYGLIKKYESKKSLLISLGTYIKPSSPQMINEFMILDFPHKKNLQMEEFLKLLKKK